MFLGLVKHTLLHTIRPHGATNTIDKEEMMPGTFEYESVERTDTGRFIKGGVCPTKPLKYTREYVQAEVDDMYDKVLADKTLITWNGLLEEKPYTRQAMYKWFERYGDVPEIMDKFDKIYEIFEGRLVENALKFKTQPVFTMFLLKAKYGYVDKQVVEHQQSEVTQISEGKLKIIKQLTDGNTVDAEKIEELEEEENSE